MQIEFVGLIRSLVLFFLPCVKWIMLCNIAAGGECLNMKWTPEKFEWNFFFAPIEVLWLASSLIDDRRNHGRIFHIHEKSVDDHRWLYDSSVRKKKRLWIEWASSEKKTEETRKEWRKKHKNWKKNQKRKSWNREGKNGTKNNIENLQKRASDG